MEAQLEGETENPAGCSSQDIVGSPALCDSTRKLRTYGCRKRRVETPTHEKVDDCNASEPKKRTKVKSVQLHLDAGQKV